MNHVRVKALKGDGKTVSRKAQKSGRASGSMTPHGSSLMTSLLTSPCQSAMKSRVTSDVSDFEDDGDLDFDDMTSSIHSGGSGPDVPDDAGTSFDVKNLMDGLQDRKHNNIQIREQYLDVFVKVLRNQYNGETHSWLDDSAASLVEIFLKEANRGTTPRGRLLSLHAYCLTIGSVEGVDVYETGSKILRQMLTDEDDQECRAFTIYALCMTVLYGGGSEEEALELMEFLVEIVRTDGDSIDAHDDVAVVSAALRGWTFVAAHVDYYADYADAAMDAFVEQLYSADVEIQSQASNCIALTYESSRSHERETGEPFELSYDPHRLAGRLSELAKLSGKSVSRKNRRDLRDSLLSVVTSLERGVGPYYSTALYMPEKETHVAACLRTEDGRGEYGYRCKLRLGKHTVVLDSWSLWSRVAMMRTIFRGGLQNHVFINQVLMDCLEDADWGEAHTADERERKTRLSAKARRR